MAKAPSLAEFARERIVLGGTTHRHYKAALKAHEVCSNFSYILGSGLIGAGVGAGIGASVGAGVGSGAGSIPAAALFAMIGLTAGTIAGCGGINYKLNKDFLKWKSQQSDEILKRFAEAFKDEESLAICLDENINLEVLQTPVIDQCPLSPHTFEKNDIENRKECPISRLEIKKDQLEIDYARLGKMQLAYRNFLKEKATEVPEELKEGIHALQRDLMRKCVYYFNQETSALRKKHDSGRLSGGDYVLKVTELNQLLHAE